MRPGPDDTTEIYCDNGHPKRLLYGIPGGVEPPVARTPAQGYKAGWIRSDYRLVVDADGSGPGPHKPLSVPLAIHQNGTLPLACIECGLNVQLTRVNYDRLMHGWWAGAAGDQHVVEMLLPTLARVLASKQSSND